MARLQAVPRKPKREQDAAGMKIASRRKRRDGQANQRRAVRLWPAVRVVTMIITTTPLLMRRSGCLSKVVGRRRNLLISIIRDIRRQCMIRTLRVASMMQDMPIPSSMARFPLG